MKYRDTIYSRMQLIHLRRQMLDKIIDLLPYCPLFQGNAYYPRRYYDDLMLDEKMKG